MQFSCPVLWCCCDLCMKDLASALCFNRLGVKISLNRFFGALRKYQHEVRTNWHRRLLILLYWALTAGKFGRSTLGKLVHQKLPP